MKQFLSSLFVLFATFLTANAQVEPMFSQTVSPSNLINIHKVENQRLNAFKAQDPRKGIELEKGQMWFSYYDPNGMLYEMGSGKKVYACGQ